MTESNAFIPNLKRPCRALATVTGLMLCAALLCACATRQTHPLLQYDPVKMTDVGIVRYYYDLGEAIDACEASSQGDTTVAVGGGMSTGGWSGVGVSVGQPVSKGCNSDSLRQRRVDTAIEMRRRNISY
ncbi:MAG: hypothetical protein AB7E32_04085 [Desulfovibrio sp.]